MKKKSRSAAASKKGPAHPKALPPARSTSPVPSRPSAPVPARSASPASAHSTLRSPARPAGRTPTRTAQRAPTSPGIIASFVVPGLPHPLLVPDANPGYKRIRTAYDTLAKRLEELNPDLLILYSTQWPSVIGHQVQTNPAPEWVHVDQEWHELGAIPYKLRVDSAFGNACVDAGRTRGLEMRAVNYHGFPVDTGSIVALKLLDPKNRFAASMVSSNMYSDRAETIVLGKAARDAVVAQGKRAVAIAVTSLSNRVFYGKVPFAEDRIHSRKDDEWNRKYLDFLERGRLEDASQLAREFSQQAGGDSKMKAIWWLAAVSGANNEYAGTVHAYEAIYGTGAAVVELVPGAGQALDKEFDEDDAEVYRGDRNVLGGASRFETADGAHTDEAAGGAHSMRGADAGKRRVARDASEDPDDLEHWSGAHSSADEDSAAGFPGAASSSTRGLESAGTATHIVHAKTAPKPVGAYAHARRAGDLLFVAGIGPRTPGTDEIPGGPIRDAKGKPRDYDVAAQTRQCIANVEAVLKESGLALKDVFEVQAFLVDMDRDFAAFNKVYGEFFEKIQATRTTVAITALPTPIAVELKVVAKFPGTQ